MREDYDVYVGRWNPKIPYHSIWHNPFKDGTREQNIARFKEYLLSRSDLLAKLPELKGKKLANLMLFIAIYNSRIIFG